jgi:hypothetical protein
MLHTAYGYETVVIKMESFATQEATPRWKCVHSVALAGMNLVYFVYEAEMDSERPSVRVLPGHCTLGSACL